MERAANPLPLLVVVQTRNDLRACVYAARASITLGVVRARIHIHAHIQIHGVIFSRLHTARPDNKISTRRVRPRRWDGDARAMGFLARTKTRHGCGRPYARRPRRVWPTSTILPFA